MITFSRHARQMLKERRLSERAVRRVVEKSNKLTERQDGTKIAQKEIHWQNRNVLCRVIYRHTSREAVWIITAYVTTKVDKYK